MSKTQEVGPS